MDGLSIREVVKTIIDLGFPAGVAIWMLYRDFKRFSYLEQTGDKAARVLTRLADLLEALIKKTDGTPPTNTR